MMDIQQLHQKGMISEIDRHFSQLMARCAVGGRDIVQLAAALVSRATAQGNVCIDLNHNIDLQKIGGDSHAAAPLVCIDPTDWAVVLNGSGVVGRPGDFKPMILDGTRLYLHRHWQYEQDVAAGIRQRCHCILSDTDARQLSHQLVHLFPEGDDWQRRAVLSALTQGFTVISGGPGTGKTHTIAKLILLMQQLNQGPALRLRLAAPTGKAAMRLQQAIESAMAGMGHSREAAAHLLLGGGTQTLHRLLGAMSGQSGFRYHAGHQLPVDVVIVDEASMIDLAMMAALMAALPATARLVLIGDKNQLASVEAGAVLGDICSGVDDEVPTIASSQLGPERAGSLTNRIVVLQHSYRFATHSGIDALAVAVNAGDTETVQSLLNTSDGNALVFKQIDDLKMLEEAIEALVTKAILPNFSINDPLEALARMERLIILSPLRNGPFGVVSLNGYVEQVLATHGAVPPMGIENNGWYAGRPVMITRNDYYHNLFNGDVGIAMAKSAPAGSDLSVFFQDGAGGCKRLSPRQLPPYETAYAMTAHKSQGSEFDHVVLVLPNRESPVLTRELVYTAITRARHSVEIWGSPERLGHAIEQRIQRSSGLMQLLWPFAQ
jgi:exodeoxyribonuclease V alpha subunit